MARALLDRGREIWEARGLLLAPIPGRREPEIEQRIRTDLLDIITVWADLRVRLAPTPQADDARREVLRGSTKRLPYSGEAPGLNASAARTAKRSAGPLNPTEPRPT